jgi:hypothetical protein
MAIIYEIQKDIPKALYHYEISYQLDKKNKFAKRKLLALKGKYGLLLIFPIFKAVAVILLLALSLYLLQR